MTKLHKGIALILLMVIAGGTYLYIQFTSASSATQAPAAPTVKEDRRVIVQGAVVPIRYAVLNVPAAGLVSEVPVSTGEKVKDGQLLLRLDNREAGEKMRRAQADLAQAVATLDWVKQNRTQEVMVKQASLESAQAELNRAEADWQRMGQLHATGAVSKQQLDQSHAAYMKSKADARLAQAQADTAQIGNKVDMIITAREAAVEGSRAYAQQMQVLFMQSELRAPFEGTVAFLNIRAGEYAALAAPVLYLGDCSQWRISTEDVTELKVARIREGAAATVTFEAIPGLEIPGRVAVISAYGEKKLGDMIYNVIIDLERQDPRLRWNMTALVKIEPE